MLYVHMAVLLNKLFFPQTDVFTSSLFTALAFCSTYILRPLGALIFGWIGDTIGRKTTVIITTFLMSICCIIMANLQTYEEKGLAVSVIITLCRAIQGISSMGEVVGAEIYLTEMISPPIRYVAVAVVSVFATLGGTMALGVASLVTSQGFSWRAVFWIGAAIALVGTTARRSLRETPEFADAKRQLKKTLEVANQDLSIIKNNPVISAKLLNKNFLAYFLIECCWPVMFYFIYVYCGEVLERVFNYTPAQVINHNFFISLVNLLGFIILTFLSYWIYPLKILKVKFGAFIIFTVAIPYFLSNMTSPTELFILQSLVILFVSDSMPAAPIFYKHFPVFKRFTSATLTYALSRAIMYVLVSFGLVYLTKFFNYWGLFIVFALVATGFAIGLSHFEKVEKEAGNYPL